MIFILIKFLLDGVFDVRKGNGDEKKGITKYFVREGLRKQRAKVLAVGERKDLEKEKKTLETRGSRKSRHVPHFCFFCMEESSRINMHYKNKHGSESRVAEIMKLMDPAQKRWAWRRLVNEGDHIYNTLVLKGNGGELKAMRKTKLPERTRKYVVCKYCAGRMLTRSLKKHEKICVQDNMEQNQIQVFEEGNPGDDGFYEEVLKTMRGDLPNFVLKNSVIYDFGRNLWYEKGFSLPNVIREKLRDLHDIVREINEIKLENSLEEYFNVKNVDIFIRIIKKTSGFAKRGKSVHFDTPSKVLRYLRLINDFGNHIKINYIKLENKEKAKEVEEFLQLIDYEANKKLKKFISLSNLKSKKQGADLPKEKDIKVIINFLKEETSKIIDELENNVNEKNWRRLAENILIRLTIFNRRRGGACEKLLLSEYAKSKPVKEDDDGLVELEESEKDYLKSLKVIEIVHKAHNLVPIYITLELQQAIEILMKYRYVAKVEKNPYVFAAGKGSKNPIRGTDVFLKYKSLLPEDCRKLFTATNLRKQGASATQFLDLSSQDKEDWSKHMGHTMEVHQRYYRLRDRPSKIINTGKILEILDKGNIKEYRGKTLREIDIQKPSTSKNISTAPESPSDFSPSESEWCPSDSSGSGQIQLHVHKLKNEKKRKSKKELTPRKTKKTKKNPLTPCSKKNLLQLYKHHFLKETLPGKSEISKNLNNPDVYSKIRNMDWKRHKDFVRNAQVSATKRKLF